MNWAAGPAVSPHAAGFHVGSAVPWLATIAGKELNQCGGVLGGSLFMLKPVFAIALAAVSTTAFARPSTLAMTCSQAQNMVASQGAVVMSTGAHTYNRFVANPGFCEFNEWANWTTAPTKDQRACGVGYTCTSTPPLEYDGGLFGPNGGF